MIARALIVILAVLNLGVAAWWLLRPAPGPAAPPAPVPGVPVLELVHSHAGTAPPGVAADDPATPLVCLRSAAVGERAAAEALRAQLAPLLRAAELDEEPGTAEIYRVLLPPAADLAAAEEAVRRVQAAGFSDVLVLRQGGDANAVALGSYRNRDTAQRRVDALHQAGFPARLRASGKGQPPRWRLLLATTQPEQVRDQLPGASAIPCTVLDRLDDGI